MKNGILDLISKSPHGKITFEQFQKAALYAPRLAEKEGGYYTAGTAQFGGMGSPTTDGITFRTIAENPQVGLAFARQFYSFWIEMGKPEIFQIVEQGGGDGSMAVHVLNAIKNGEFYNHVRYTILDISGELLERQKAKLKAAGHQNVDYVRGSVFNMPFPDESIEGVFFSNELPDAFPVHRVIVRNGKLKEIFVRYENGELKESEDDISTSAAQDYFKLAGSLPPEGKEFAVNLHLFDWMREVARTLRRGFVVTSDYGFEKTEDRYRSSLRESVWNFSGKPLLEPGIDTTHNVDFETLKKIGQRAGLKTEHVGALPIYLLFFAPVMSTVNEKEFVLIQSKGIPEPAASAVPASDRRPPQSAADSSPSAGARLAVNDALGKFGINIYKTWITRKEIIDFRLVPGDVPWVMDRIRNRETNPIVTVLDEMPQAISVFDLDDSKVFKEADDHHAKTLLGLIRTANGTHPAVFKRFPSSFRSPQILEELLSVQVYDRLGVSPRFYGVLRNDQGQIIGYATQVVIGDRIDNPLADLKYTDDYSEISLRIMQGDVPIPPHYMETRTGRLVAMADKATYKGAFDDFIRKMELESAKVRPAERKIEPPAPQAQVPEEEEMDVDKVDLGETAEEEAKVSDIPEKEGIETVDLGGPAEEKAQVSDVHEEERIELTPPPMGQEFEAAPEREAESVAGEQTTKISFEFSPLFYRRSKEAREASEDRKFSLTVKVTKIYDPQSSDQAPSTVRVEGVVDTLVARDSTAPNPPSGEPLDLKEIYMPLNLTAQDAVEIIEASIKAHALTALRPGIHRIVITTKFKSDSGARLAAENISSMGKEIEGYLSEARDWLAQEPWKFFDVEEADEKQAEDIGKHLETLNKIIEKRYQRLSANSDAATAVMLRIRHQEILRAAQDQVILLKALTDLQNRRLPLHETIHSNANTTHRIYKMEWRGESYTVLVLTRWGEGNMGQEARFQMKIRMPGQRQRPNLRIDYSKEPMGASLDAPESMHRFTTSKTRHRKLPRLNHFGTFSRFIQKLDRRMWMDTSQFSPENPFGFEKEGRLPTGIVQTLYNEKPVDEKQAVTFIAKVYQTKKETGFIAVGNSAFEVQINRKGELLVYGFGKLLRVLDRAAYQSIVLEERNLQSYQVTLSMSDFKQILDQAYALIDALEINESLNSKKAVAVIDLNGLLPGMPAFDEIRVPLLIREIKRAKKQSWGRNAKFLLKGDAETVERVMAQVRAFYGKEPDFIAAKEEDLKDYGNANRIIITSPDLHFMNEGAGQRHFFIQSPREGDLPNFRGAFKLSLALARLDKLEATDPALVEIIRTFELVLGHKIINPNELINIWQGRAHHPLHSRRYALPPLAKLSLQALLQGARLAIKMAEQAA